MSRNTHDLMLRQRKKKPAPLFFSTVLALLKEECWQLITLRNLKVVYIIFYRSVASTLREALITKIIPSFAES